MYSFHLNLHKYQLYLSEQYSELFNIWSANIMINTEGESLSMNASKGRLV